jgi:GNAT superfamily N-acetyltransferase
MENDYQIILARPEHLVALPAIERSAADIFPEEMISDEARDYVLSPEEFEKALAKKHLWVAITADNQPVGFALVTVNASASGKSGMLAELDVDPAHQQKGLGTAMVQTVINWAREEGFNHLALTTFSNVPWNAPFYEKMGFRRLHESELTVELIAALDCEAKLGLKDRVAMQITLAKLVDDMRD